MAGLGERLVDGSAELISGVIVQVEGGGVAALVFAFLGGVLLSLSPTAFPSLPAVVALTASTSVTEEGGRLRRALALAPTVGAFVVGMDAPVAILGYLFVDLVVLLIRASVVLAIITLVVFTFLGVRLLARKASVCDVLGPVPQGPGRAFGYGVGLSVTGCVGCAPLLIGLGAAASLLGGPLIVLAALAAFLLGRTLVLLGVSTFAGELVVRPRGARAVNMIVGSALLAVAAVYGYLLLTGQISSIEPGAPGSGQLPG